MDYLIERLQPAHAPAFAALTFPRYRPLLSPGGTASDLLMFGAWAEDRPAGLLLAEVNRADNTVELLSIATRRDCRRRGIASSLLDTLANSLEAEPYSRLVTSFTQAAEKEAAIAPLLRRRGWAEPVLKMTLFDLAVEAVFTSSWVESVTNGPARFDIRPFGPQISPDLEAVSLESWVPPELAPAKHMHQGLDGAAILTPVSFAYYEDDSVAGWHFSHRLDAETIRFSVSYVRPDAQRDLALLELWYKAALGARELGYARIKFGVAVHHRKMLSFCSSFLGPISDKVSLSLSSYRKLRFDDVWA